MEKRILVYTNHYDPEYFKINDIVKWLSDEGANVSVITGNPNYPLGKLYDGFSLLGSKETINKELTIYRLPLITRGKGAKFRIVLNYLTYFLSSMIFTVWCLFFHKKYDVIFVHHTSPPLLFIPALFYKKIIKSKAILWDLDMWPQTLESMDVVKNKRIINVLESIFKQLYRGFDKVLIGSKSFEKMALNRIPNHKIDYFPNWADDIFETLNLEINPPKQQDEIIITYTGNIGEAQGFEVLVNALKESSNKKIVFYFIGSGRYKDQLKELVSKNNLNSKIHFFDPVASKDLIPFFEKTHYLYFSLKNTLLFSSTVPAKLQTYLTTGKPIISSISGEARTLLTKNQCGFHVESEDKFGLLDTFNRLSGVTPSQYIEFSKNSKRLYHQSFLSNNRRQQIFENIFNNIN